MEMAKVTSKGQITIPISIRRRLGINEGDKILFVNKQDGVLMLNPDTVQGDIADYAIDSVPPEEVSAKPAAASKATVKTPAPAPVPTPAAVTPSAAEKPASAGIETDSPLAAPIDPPKRKYIPPVEEPEPQPAQPGGINLNTLLDDIRSIGSNI